MQRRSKPIAWRPHGLSDALDASMGFNGCMLQLQNLIPDPSTRDLWQCRPAAILLMDLATGGPFSTEFSTEFQTAYFKAAAGAISCFKVVGNYVYGMAADGAIPGYDAPFAFNLTTKTLINMTGTISTTTLPVSQPASGAWTPPQMDVIGSKIAVAHPGFNGSGGNYFGWFDISNPTAPVWNAGNLTGAVSAFTTAPISVRQFNNRTWWLYNLTAQPAVVFTDALSVQNCTNANQILTFGDSVPLTALGALPLNNVLGGIIQSLIVFKGATNMYQITGDAASSTSPLTVNSLDVATGTYAQNSVNPTPKGLGFMAPDGMRIINFQGNVSDPIGLAGSGVTVPFIFSSVPSRVAACCNGDIMRITTQNGNMSANPNYEYWYDFGRQVWSGPHTFPASLIQPWGDTFLVAPVGIVATIWQSDPAQSLTSSFVENGNQLTWIAQTALLPDTDMLTNNCMTEGSLDLSLPPNSAPIQITAADQNGASINAVTVSPPSTGATTIWGQFTWGSAPWAGGIPPVLTPYELPWTIPIVFARMTLQANGNSALGLKVGSWHARYQVLRTYVSTAAAA